MWDIGNPCGQMDGLYNDLSLDHYKEEEGAPIMWYKAPKLNKTLFKVSKVHSNTGISVFTCNGDKFSSYLQCKGTKFVLKEWIKDDEGLIEAQLLTLQGFNPKSIEIAQCVYDRFFSVNEQEVMDLAYDRLKAGTVKTCEEAIILARKELTK